MKKSPSIDELLPSDADIAAVSEIPAVDKSDPDMASVECSRT